MIVMTIASNITTPKTSLTALSSLRMAGRETKQASVFTNETRLGTI
jgi:hypothetical protein